MHSRQAALLRSADPRRALSLQAAQAREVMRPWRSVLFVLAITSRSWAQEICGATNTTTLLVNNVTGALDELKAAVNCTNGGRVDAVWAGAVTLDAAISIGEGTFLFITGEDNLAEAQGGLVTRIFDVSPGAGLALTQLKLSAGVAQSGGAIRSDAATLTLDSCVFDTNYAVNGSGGAVWVDGGEVTIIGGEFLGNIATGVGGAVFAMDATLVVEEGTLLEGNTAVEGGALYCGGAEVALNASSASCSVSDAVFVSNNASREAGSDLIRNDYDGGGAAAFWYAQVDVSDCEFNGNWAQRFGGALIAGSGAATVVTVDGCTFGNNTTSGYGGAIAASSVTVGGDTELRDNSAVWSGGAVSIDWVPT